MNGYNTADETERTESKATRRAVLVAATTGSLGGLAGCLGSLDVTGSSEQNDGEFVVGLHNDPTEDRWSVYGDMVPYFTQVLEPLVGVSENVEPEPLLATDWEQTAETTWRFDLQEDVQFHDGTTLEAKHVVDSFDAVFDHWEWVPGWIGVEPDGVTAVDDRAVEFETTEPFPAFPGTITHHYFGIQRPNADDPPVGTGPFQAESVGNGEVRLIPNEQYRHGEPDPSQVVFEHVEDPNTRVLSLEDGEVDVAHDVPKEQAARVSDNSDTDTVVQLGNHAGLAAVNLYKEPTDDETLRQALNWAVDQEQLVETVLDGYGKPARGPFSSAIPWAIHDDLPTHGPDREHAKSLVEQSNYDDETLSILIDSEEADDRAIAQVLQEWFSEIGVDSEIEQVEPASFYETFTNGEAHLTLVGFGSNSASSDYLVRAMFHSTGSDNRQLYEAEGTGVYNPGEEVDELIEEGYRAETLEEKTEYYGEVQQRVVETGAIVPLYYDEYVLGYRSDVENIDLHPIDKFLDWTELSR